MWQITGECSGRRQTQCQHAKSRHSSCHGLDAKGAGYKPRAHMLIRIVTAQRLSMTRLDLLNVRGRLA